MDTDEHGFNSNALKALRKLAQGWSEATTLGKDKVESTLKGWNKP